MRNWIGAEPALGLFALVLGIPIFLYYAIEILGLFRATGAIFYNDPIGNPVVLLWLAFLAITGLQSLRRLLKRRAGAPSDGE